MNGVCDMPNCNDRARYRTPEGIELCEYCFKMSEQQTPVIILQKKTALSPEERRIIKALEKNGGKLRIDQVEMIVDSNHKVFKILERMILNGAIQVI